MNKNDFMSFLLPHDISKFKINNNHTILPFFINPNMITTENANNSKNLLYDGSILNSFEDSGMKLAIGNGRGSHFGEIYIKFNNLFDKIDGLYSRLIMISQSLLHRELSEDEKRIALTKVKKIVDSCSEQIINICSENFVLQTDLFLYRTIDRTNVNLLQNLNTLHGNQLKIIFKSVGIDESVVSPPGTPIVRHDTIDLIFQDIISKSSVNPGSIKFTVNGYDTMQPDSFWVYTNDWQTNDIYYPTSDNFKIHISFNPLYINDALKCLLKFIIKNPLDNKYSKYSDFIRNSILEDGRKPPTADDLKLVSSLFTQFKVQAISPIHLYKNTHDWSDWDGISERMPNGIGYIVIYPCKNYPFNDLMKLFIDHWVPNFEKKFPNAKRDENYIMYNERVTETIYITPTGSNVDTKKKEQARQSRTKNICNKFIDKN